MDVQLTHVCWEMIEAQSSAQLIVIQLKISQVKWELRQIHTPAELITAKIECLEARWKCRQVAAACESALFEVQEHKGSGHVCQVERSRKLCLCQSQLTQAFGECFGINGTLNKAGLNVANFQSWRQEFQCERAEKKPTR